MNILKNLKNVPSAMLAVSTALILFNVNYWMMANLPGFKNLTCAIGAGLTSVNIVYSIVISLLAGILVGNLPQFIKIRSAKSSAGGFTGVALGSFTIFCPWLSHGLPLFSIAFIWFSLFFLCKP